MNPGSFSRTALSVAAMRAAHQSADGARIFVDPLAARALTDEDGAALARAGEPARRPLRLFVALRSRIAEDAALAAVAAGARQIVVLGAGLDTFAHRLAPRPGLRVFEIDHPATQAEKRRRFALNGLDPPAHLTYAPCDFERDTLEIALAAADFEANARAVFLWLGVVPYLTASAVEATLRFAAARPGGGEIVFDYANPPETLEDAQTRRTHEAMAARVARLGEPFQSYFETQDLHRKLAEWGFDGVDDWGPRRISARLGGEPREEDRGGHIVHARRR